MHIGACKTLLDSQNVQPLLTQCIAQRRGELIPIKLLIQPRDNGPAGAVMHSSHTNTVLTWRYAIAGEHILAGTQMQQNDPLGIRPLTHGSTHGSTRCVSVHVKYTALWWDTAHVVLGTHGLALGQAASGGGG